MIRATVARRGRGKAKASLEQIDACLEILREIQPASVRAVCYRLFTLGLIPSMSKASTNKVSGQLVYAREHDIIPWEWIVDETRAVERISSWRDPDRLIASAVEQYRRDAWQEQPLRVEVWSEKGTVRGTLAPILNEYGISFRVMHGYASATALWTAAEDSLASEKPLHVFYVGDFDPSGLHMSDADLPERLSRYGGEVVLSRVALDTDDLDGLPSFPVASKTGDPRHDWFVRHYGLTCWELDAMPPPDLREKVEATICGLLDLDAWEHAKHIESAQIESLHDFWDGWQSSQS